MFQIIPNMAKKLIKINITNNLSKLINIILGIQS